MRLLKIAIITVMMFICCTTVNAENILNRVDIDVVVHKDGSASVKESWNATVDSGSEFTRDFKHLNYSTISDFKVKDESGDEYVFKKTWDSSASRLDKFTANSFKTKINGDTTLYWGLGNYGQRAYVLNYTINDFVSNSSDGQISYFTFMSPGGYIYPNTIELRMSFEDSDIDLSSLQYKIYGLQAENNIDGNEIVITSEKNKVNSQSYLVTLVKFDENAFNCQTTLNKSYEDIVSECDKVSGVGVKIKPVSFKEILMIAIAGLLLIGVIWYIVTEIQIRKRTKNTTGLSVSYLGAKISKAPNEDLDTNDKNSLYRIYTIGFEYGIVQNLYSIVSALIVKWVANEFIKIDFINKDSYEFKIVKQIETLDDSDDFEKELFDAIMEDNELNLSAFEAKVKENAELIKKWINNVLLSESRMLNDNGLLKTVELSKRLKKHMTFTEFKCTQISNKEAGKIQRFKEELKKISLEDLNNNNKIVYAQLFNVTNNIDNKSNEFEKFIIAINRLNQIITVRMESYNRASRTDIINDVLDKVAKIIE